MQHQARNLFTAVGLAQVKEGTFEAGSVKALNKVITHECKCASLGKEVPSSDLNYTLLVLLIDEVVEPMRICFQNLAI